jgi:hypothetical protein
MALDAPVERQASSAVGSQRHGVGQARHLADMPALEHRVVLAQQRAVIGLQTYATQARIHAV